MNYKNYIKSLLIFIGIILLSTLLITFLYHKNIINSNILNILKKLILPISTIIIGFYIGIKSKNKAYINGLTIGTIIITIIIFLRLVIIKEIKLINILTYLLILLIITISSILGINKRRH